METLRLILLIVHILGFSALIGGLLAQVGPGEKKVTGVMRDGIGTAFLAGLLLVGVLEGGDDPVNHAKVGVKSGHRAGPAGPGDGQHAQGADPAGPVGRAARAGRRRGLHRGALVARPPLSNRPAPAVGTAP
ncbi:hypothetical protein [Nocardioides convexus]|uniref:hypothetical protein n=1 Tax=Nocardioides convexus TaxID=2712224 RepID=UPI0024186325|nr:hypothetical protein [Nocardioides convexus]